MSSAVIKGISIVFQAVSVPIILSLYGKSVYGLFATVYAILNILNFTDLGLGWSLQNELPRFIEQKDHAQINRYIANTFYVLLGMAAVLLLGLWAFTSLTSVSDLFGVAENRAVFDTMFSLSLLMFILGTPFSIGNRIYAAFQEMYMVNFWRFFYWMLTFGALYAVWYYRIDIETYVLFERGANTLYFVLSLIGVWLFRKRLSLPHPRWIDPALIRFLLFSGVSLLFIQVMFVTLSSIDNVLVLRLTDPENAARFAIGMKLVTIASTPVIMFVTPIVPAVNDAFIRQDRYWITHEFMRRMRWFVLPLLLVPVVYLLSADWIIQLWVGDEIELTFLEQVSFALFLPSFILLVFVYSTMFNKLYSRFLMRLLIIALLVLAVLKTAAVYWFGPTIPSILLPTVVTILAVLFVPFVVRFYRDGWLLNKQELAALERERASEPRDPAE